MRARPLRGKRKKAKLYGDKSHRYREVPPGSRFKSHAVISKYTIPKVCLKVGNWNNAHLPALFGLIRPLRHLQVK